MVYRNNAGRLGSGFISVCLETHWLGQKSGFYVPERPCIGYLKPDFLFELFDLRTNQQIPALGVELLIISSCLPEPPIKYEYTSLIFVTFFTKMRPRLVGTVASGFI